MSKTSKTMAAVALMLIGADASIPWPPKAKSSSMAARMPSMTMRMPSYTDTEDVLSTSTATEAPSATESASLDELDDEDMMSLMATMTESDAETSMMSDLLSISVERPMSSDVPEDQDTDSEDEDGDVTRVKAIRGMNIKTATMRVPALPTDVARPLTTLTLPPLCGPSLAPVNGQHTAQLRWHSHTANNRKWQSAIGHIPKTAFDSFTRTVASGGRNDVTTASWFSALPTDAQSVIRAGLALKDAYRSEGYGYESQVQTETTSGVYTTSSHGLHEIVVSFTTIIEVAIGHSEEGTVSEYSSYPVATLPTTIGITTTLTFTEPTTTLTGSGDSSTAQTGAGPIATANAAAAAGLVAIGVAVGMI